MALEQGGIFITTHRTSVFAVSFEGLSHSVTLLYKQKDTKELFKPDPKENNEGSLNFTLSFVHFYRLFCVDIMVDLYWIFTWP